MELVAIDMKLSGKYIARQLSFKGVTFEIDEVDLSDEFVKMYDECVELWEDAREKFQTALDLMEEDPKKKKHYWGRFSHSSVNTFEAIRFEFKFSTNLLHPIFIRRQQASSGPPISDSSSTSASPLR